MLSFGILPRGAWERDISNNAGVGLSAKRLDSHAPPCNLLGASKQSVDKSYKTILIRISSLEHDLHNRLHPSPRL